MAKYIVREGTLSDGQVMLDLLHEIYPDDSTISQDEFNELNFGPQRKSYPFVAELCSIQDGQPERKEIVGCVLFSILTDYLNGTQVFIQGLVVRQEHRGNGISKELLAKANEVGEQSGCKSAFALIQHDNTRSMNVFRKFGGEVIWGDYSVVYCKKMDCTFTSNMD